MPERNASKGLPTLTAELRDLVVKYAKQETVDPLKSLVRFVLLGVGGSVMLSIGLVFLALAGLRALQTEMPERFDGELSGAAPYGITLFGCIVVSAFAARAIGAARRRNRK